MGRAARLIVSSEQTAATALEYFNGFHDGFIQRLALVSEDRIEADLSQTCTGRFHVTIDFAHYNYADGAAPFHPHTQRVHAEFRSAQDIFADFGSGFLGNTILNLSIRAASRRSPGQLTTEPCLGLRLTRHYYLEEQRRYEVRESQLFTFLDAVFVEQAPIET